MVGVPSFKATIPTIATIATIATVLLTMSMSKKKTNHSMSDSRLSRLCC